jgi:hypothetical protein
MFISIKREGTMPFTVEEFRDLLRILEERPEWRAELRRLVLTDELLTLPELVRALTEAQRRTEERLAALIEAQQRTEERVAALEDRVTALEDRVTALEERLAALIDAQRRTEERLAALIEVQQRTEERVAALEERFAVLIEVQQHMDRRLDTLTNDMAGVKGVVLEIRYRERAFAYFAPLLRRTRLLSGDEIQPLLEEAIAQGQLSEAEVDDLLLADVILRGRRREDNAEVYLLAEVSWKVDPYDVERAVRRATLLSRTGLPVIPVVAGTEVTEEAASLAGMLHVRQLTDGHALPPQHDDTSHGQSPSCT